MALDRSLDDFDLNQTYHNVDSLQVCVEMCVPRNKYLAYNQQTHLCICMAIMSMDVFSKRVPHEKFVMILKRDDASNLMEMYHTGFLGRNKILKHLVENVTNFWKWSLIYLRAKFSNLFAHIWSNIDHSWFK